MPEDVPWADPVVVPDDIRDLQADIDAYHRELRAARRRHRWHRLTASAAWRRWSFPVGVLTGAVAIAAAVFGMLALDGGALPHATRPAVALATPSVAPGRLGGLLPDLPLALTTGASAPARSIRPALVALVPPQCRCTALLDGLAAQAEEVQLPLVVVGPPQPDAEVAALPGQVRHGRVLATYDNSGSLATTYAAHGVTALIVGADGVVSYVQHDVTRATRLELPLQAALLLGGGS
jgi:hypothetical protein